MYQKIVWAALLWLCGARHELRVGELALAAGAEWGWGDSMALVKYLAGGAKKKGA